MEREALADIVMRRFEHEVTVEMAENGRNAADTAVLWEADLILMDIEMPLMDGMTAAKCIRELDQSVIIIFITNMAKYAIKGYAVDALDYVLKPVPYFAFSQQLLKALARLEKRAKHYLTVPVEGGLRRLDTASIYYLESEGHRVLFYTDEGDFSAPGAL